MKKIITLMLATLLLFTISGCTQPASPDTTDTSGPDESSSSLPPNGTTASPSETTKNDTPQDQSPKILIVYLSPTNNTRTIAEYIHEAVGGDVFEVVPVEAYPEAYDDITAQVAAELEEGYLPPIMGVVEDMASYDIIFVGSPIWWGTIGPPISTFLTEYNLSGKTVVPFCTHAGSGQSESVNDLMALCPDSTVLDGYVIAGSQASTARDSVEAWLTDIGLLVS